MKLELAGAVSNFIHSASAYTPHGYLPSDSVAVKALTMV